MSERKMVCKTVVDCEIDNLEQFAQVMTSTLEEYREHYDTDRLEWDFDHDDSMFVVNVWELETDEQYAARIESEKFYETQVKERVLQCLESLRVEAEQYGITVNVVQNSVVERRRFYIDVDATPAEVVSVLNGTPIPEDRKVFYFEVCSTQDKYDKMVDALKAVGARKAIRKCVRSIPIENFDGSMERFASLVDSLAKQYGGDAIAQYAMYDMGSDTVIDIYKEREETDEEYAARIRNQIRAVIGEKS